MSDADLQQEFVSQAKHLGSLGNIHYARGDYARAEQLYGTSHQ